MGNLSLNNALTGILSNQEALDVISQNIANASDENYSRQRAILKSNQPLFQDGKFFGTGVNVEDVARVRNELLEDRLNNQTQTLGRFNQLEDVFQQIETILNEPSDDSIRGTFSDLNASLQSLANDPENRGGRSDLIGRATTFANVLKRMNTELQKIAGTAGTSSSVSQQIRTTLDEINNIGQEIASLNEEISTSRARGASPNDLLDERDELINNLSQFIDTSVRREPGEFRVNVSGYTLVQGGFSHELSFGRKGGDPKRSILYDNVNRDVIRPKDGELRGLLDVRDEVVPKIVDQVNDLAVQYVDRFNDQHRAGFGLDGQTGINFFDSLPTASTGIYRIEGINTQGGSIERQRAGYVDSPDTALIGDPDTAEPENFEGHTGVFDRDTDGNVIGSPTGTLNVNGFFVNYDMSEDSLRDVVNRINEADNEAEAYVSAENRLVIKGSQANDYRLDELSDSGLLLEKANLLTVGGSDRTGGENVDATSQALLDSANFAGNPRLDSTHAVGAAVSSGSEVSINVPDASVYDVGDEIRITDNTGTAEVATITATDTGSDPNSIELNGLANNYNNTATITGTGDDPARGRLEFTSSNSPAFSVRYNARTDSVEDVITKIVNAADAADSKVSAELTEDDRLRLFASKQSPQAVAMRDPQPNPGPGDTTIEVNNIGVFSTGDEVRIYDDNGAEKATVTNVNTGTNELTVSNPDVPGGTLINSYDESQNGQVQLLSENDPDAEFSVEDRAGPADTVIQSLQGTTGPPDAGTALEVSDAGQFNVGDEVRVFDDDAFEKTTITSVDVVNNTITADLTNTYQTADSARVESDSTSQLLQQDSDFNPAAPAAPVPPQDLDPKSTFTVEDAGEFEVGQTIEIADDNNSETTTITALNTASNTLTADLENSYSAADNARVTREGTPDRRNLLTTLGVDRLYDRRRSATEFAITGDQRRPPIAEQVQGVEVNARVQNNPDLVAAAQGDDLDLDGIAETSQGPGDGSNALALAGLRDESILDSGSVSPDEHINEFITGIGSESSLAQREQEASEKLVDDLRNQRQAVSGVNIDEELTQMIQHQQIFQASARVISTVQELNQSLLAIV